MSKKRQSRKSTRQRQEEQAVSESVQQANGRGRTGLGSFNPDYSQTIKDLKRIAVLAGSFFMVLVVLSFFLR